MENLIKWGIEVLCCLAAAFAVRYAVSLAAKPCTERALTLFLPIGNNGESAEYLLRKGIRKLSAAGGARVRIVCIDRGMDEETRKICRIFERSCPAVEIRKRNESTDFESGEAGLRQESPPER